MDGDLACITVIEADGWFLIDYEPPYGVGETERMRDEWVTLVTACDPVCGCSSGGPSTSPPAPASTASPPPAAPTAWSCGGVDLHPNCAWHYNEGNCQYPYWLSQCACTCAGPASPPPPPTSTASPPPGAASPPPPRPPPALSPPSPSPGVHLESPEGPSQQCEDDVRRSSCQPTRTEPRMPRLHTRMPSPKSHPSHDRSISPLPPTPGGPSVDGRPRDVPGRHALPHRHAGVRCQLHAAHLCGVQ
eukprot:1193187-Prymnesium_polylepis.1